VYGDNFIASQNFYLDAVGSYKKHVPNFYQGDMNFACIPLKLRLAIETYFKNMIGYASSTQEFLTGRRKGDISPYPLSISDLLRFFENKNYSKYIKSPVNLGVLRDINYWSNNLMHTGIISFAWQNLSAIDYLSPLFYTKHENGYIHLEGFNYFSPDHDQSELARDLSDFLSDRTKKISVYYFKFTEKPFEGAFFYPRNITKKSK